MQKKLIPRQNLQGEETHFKTYLKSSFHRNKAGIFISQVLISLSEVQLPFKFIFLSRPKT